MTTPQPPRNDDAPDGRVAASLWRLRARLVTPPDAQRAQSDLDQIMAAAREHAHDAPVAGATATPHRHPDVEVEAGATVRALTPRTDAQRAPARWMRVSRVAAVTVLIVGVGGGIASAVGDGGLLLPLRSPDNGAVQASPASNASADGEQAASDDDETPDRDGEDVLAPDEPADADAASVDGPRGGGVDASDSGAADGSAAADGGSTEAADAGDGAADDGDAIDGAEPSGPSSGSSGGVAEDGAEPDPGRVTPDGAGDEDGDAGSGEDGGSTDGDGAGDEDGDAGSGEDGGSTDGDGPGDTIVALPEEPADPGSIDGFGGAPPCPDGSNCLPGSEEPAAGDTGADPDGAGGDGSDVDGTTGPDGADDDGSDDPAIVTEDPRLDDDGSDDSLDDLAARRAGS